MERDGAAHQWAVAVDRTAEGNVTLTVELPGYGPDAVGVELVQEATVSTLHVTARHAQRGDGTLQLRLTDLGPSERIRAAHEHGVLTVALPGTTPTPAVRVPVQIGTPVVAAPSGA
jgi:HSP20 family molecular chaperone IbpA